MTQRVADLTSVELEQLIARVVDERMASWSDYLLTVLDRREDDRELSVEFAEGLCRAQSELEAGEGIGLETLREELGVR